MALFLCRSRFRRTQLFDDLPIPDKEGIACYGETMTGKLAKSHHSRCRKTGAAVTEICRDSACEWFVNREGFFNCTWVACHFGPFTLEEVGAMMGVTRERIRQIESKALTKMQQRKRKDQLRDYSDSAGKS
jgi:hypothetical protein